MLQHNGNGKRMMDAIDLAEKLACFEEHWSPKIVGELNGQLVKLAKLKGEFVWHHHADEDELFLVLKGEMTMRYRDREVIIGEGQFCIVPRGVEHMPVAVEECHVLLFEPESVLNTGSVVCDRTVRELDIL
jgi:mannose-6-phosphate isomerase-like protein (cupin superfamily)